MIDARDLTQVTAALDAWVQRRAPGARIERAPAIIGRGFDTHIYAFGLSDPGGTDLYGDLVLRLYGAPEHAAKARHEAAAQQFALSAGYPALAPLVVEDAAPEFGLPLMIMPLVAGGTMLERIAGRPWRAGGLLGEMAVLHARLHQLPTAGCPLADPAPHAVRQMHALRTRAAPVMATPGLDDALRWLDERMAMALPEERSFTHNDFHPLNLLSRPEGGFTVIDWSDATVGDRACDVARTVTLLSFAYIAAGSAIERFALRSARGFLRSRYLDRYKREYPLDPGRFAWWCAQQAATGWVQILELDHNRASGAAVTDAAAAIPQGMGEEGWKYVQARLREAERVE